MENRVSTSALSAARKFGPGYFIREQMELREWTQDDLSAVTGMSVKHLNQILQDKLPVSIDLARIFAEVFNTSATYWVNLNTAYRLWLTREKTPPEQEADLKANIYERMPVKDMLAKGWLQPFQSAEALQTQVLRFWGWRTLDFSILDRQYLPCLTRRSEAYNQFNASYAVTWYRKAQLVAETFARQPYEREKLAVLFDEMHVYTTLPNGINRFIEALAEVGVIFFVLPHLKKTYLDGAAFFSGPQPVLVYTGRHHRIDNFWFTLAHEIAHVLLHLNEETPFVLDNLKSGETDRMEAEANALAAEKLKHPEILRYLERSLGYLPPSKVEECAAEYNVHPSIVIGKLAHAKKISYSNQSLYNDNVLLHIHPPYQFNNE